MKKSTQMKRNLGWFWPLLLWNQHDSEEMPEKEDILRIKVSAKKWIRCVIRGEADHQKKDGCYEASELLEQGIEMKDAIATSEGLGSEELTEQLFERASQKRSLRIKELEAGEQAVAPTCKVSAASNFK